MGTRGVQVCEGYWSHDYTVVEESDEEKILECSRCSAQMIEYKG